MEKVENTQLVEISQCENTGSEQADYEEDASTADNSDTQILRVDSPISLTTEKTDEDKTIHNTDNALSNAISSPKAALLGKLKAKQRLQAFLLPKQNPFLNSPTKKIEDIQIPAKSDKNVKKPKQSPIEKAKSIIEELEEIKKVENAKQQLASPLFKERKPTYREKHYRKKSRSRSLEPVRKPIEKGRYPESWQEMKKRKLSLEDVQEIKLTKGCKNTKQQDNCHDFRKQLLFELPAQPLSSFKFKGVGGQDKTVPSQYIRFTKELPSISYSINHYKNREAYLSTLEVYNYIPKSHLDIITKLRTDNSIKFTEGTPKKDMRKWYTKQMLGNVADGCELLEKSLGLSILQSYMDEEEDDEKNGINLTDKEISKNDQGIDFSKTAEETPHEDDVNIELKELESFSPGGKENILLFEKEEISNVESEDESPRKKKLTDKKDKYERKKEKKDKKELRKRKRKKASKEKDVKEVKKKSSKSDKKNDKRNECNKETKNKKKDGTKADKKIDSDEKKKHKENKEKEVTKMDNSTTELENDIKRDKAEDKCNKRDKSTDDKKTEDLKSKKSNKKEHKKPKNKQLSLTVPLYYDELESIRGRSLSKEKDKNPQEKSRESSRESKKTRDSSKGCCKKVSRKGSEKEKEKTRDKPDSSLNEIVTVKLEEEKKVKTEKIEKQNHHKEPEKIKQEDLFEIEPLNSGEGLGTPDTEEYHSHWESDEDVRNVISYSPLLPLKINSSWESDEDIPSPEKVIHDRYSPSRSAERRSRKYLDGERSLEMPLNIINLSRKDQRKSGKSSDFPDRKFLGNDTRLRYEEDSWERGEFLKMCNDIEGEKLRHERKTLSEERRLLEWEKRKLAEKLDKRTFKRDIFNNLEDSFVKEVTYEKIHGENEEIYLKSTDYILNNRKTLKSNDHSIQKKYERKSRKRTRSTDDLKQQTIEDDHKQYKHDKPKKFKHDKLDDVDVKYEKDDLLKYDSTDNVSGHIEKDKMFLSNLKNPYKPSETPTAKDESRSSKYKYEKPKDTELSKGDLDNLITSDSKETSKSDILENEYEEFLKAVTGDIAKSENKNKDRKSDKKAEIKKSKSSKRRKYSSSSSSSSSSSTTSSSSDSDDSDSSSSSSSSSSYSTSSTSSSEREKKRRKIKAKHKERDEGKEKPVKIEMTHSIVKNLDDLQAFPISKPPVIQIKQEQEDPGYSELPTTSSMIKDVDHTVPLPVPSPAIVPPPYLSLLPVKQEKAESISSKADSTTSPLKKTPLIPTKFVSSLLRKECGAFNTPHSSTLLDVPKKDDLNSKDVINQTAVSKNSHFSFSIANKRMAFGEGMDSDSQEFKDTFASKKTICEEDIPAVVESSKPVNDGKDTPEAVATNEPLSPPRKEASLSKSIKEESSSSGEKPSPDMLLTSSPKQVDISPDKNLILKDVRRSSDVESSRRTFRKSLSPKHRNLSPRKTRDRSPLHRKSSRQSDEASRRYSPKRRRSPERNDKRRSSPHRIKKNQSSRSRTLSSPRSRRSSSPKRRKSPSPRNQRSHSPATHRSASPRSRRSPFRNRSPNYRSSPPRKSYKRSYSRSPSPVRRKESIQKTLQRLAGMEDYLPSENASPINSPVDGFKRSVADSTISDDQLLQQNSAEPFDSPAYRTSTKLVQAPPSPKRVPLDIRISQVLGLDKENPTPITTVYTQTNHVQNYTYDQYSEQYGHYPHYNQNILPNDNYVEQQSMPKPQTHTTSKVVQIGNMLQVVPTEEAPPQDHKPPTQKIVQVGNMLQIVPTPSSHVTKETPIPTQVHVGMHGVVQGDMPLGVLQPVLPMSQAPPPPLASMDRSNLNSTSTHEKLSPEELMMQKIAERRAERAKRHEDREKKRNEKEKRRKEKERKKQLRLKIKTENMIKKALRIETEALAMGENMDDDENAMDVTPSCWPSISAVASSPLKAAGKGILITHGFSKLNIDDDSEQKRCKCVKFADGVVPGEGTSPSGGEELSSPPPPKEKRFKKIKKKKVQKKKKIKVKIIRKSSADSPDDEELDNLPPPSPPPGSPPPHIFPARIKTHANNNIHPSYATGVPLMPVGNYPPQFRPSIPMAVPPPIHNLPPPAPRPPPQIMSPHIPPPVHGSMSHGLSPGVSHCIPNHPHGSMHHPAGPRV